MYDNTMKPLNPIEHSHPVKLGWDVFLLACILFAAVITPYRLTFGDETNDVFYWVITLVFVLDIVMHFNTAVQKADTLVTNRNAIALAYLKSGLIVDIIAAFPFVLFSGWSALVPLQLLRLAKLWKFNKTLTHLQEVIFFSPVITRLIVFGFWSVLVIHFVALGWISIGAGVQEGANVHRYILALYWALSTMSTIGYGDITPDKNQHVQVIYTMFVQIIGVSMFGYVVGNIASILTNIDIAKRNFLKKMEDINGFFKANRIPSAIQSKVHGYYRYLWESRGTIETDQTVISEMPDSLRVEILLFLNSSIVEKVAMFKGMDEDFIRQVVQLLETGVYLPNDYIIRQGELGESMYFLLNGEVEVIVDGQIVAHLASGSPFGEAALLHKERRNASIRTLGYCDVYSLSKKHFDALRQKYPEFDARVQQVMESRSKH